MGVDYEQYFNLTDKKAAMSGEVSVVPISTPLGAGEYWHCPDGSHFAMYDDQATYFNGWISLFLPTRVTRLKYTR
jgi:hypothetical protein